ncbi:MAG: lipid-A-disaccharide synthase [Armatimonadota bacterium]|nr:lipid-A-disaccharide synthase [Armatimonadota bacterium]MDR7440078.1 lipid-A-disaccharide synthase [Armatimonadota bacterium]MDR7563821.1 lipid-A-disaccharide synthase [Armatimonadota bacterium]MDR7567598.1 lipid-A-disaccharide synthase [Armatimonadota bacterium]MDR7601668.1 lipid-A-disaccharide synthase [Armatimonadota bacterium]
MKVFLLAGEVSGDVAAAHLTRALRVLEPRVEVVGGGGERMRDAGVRVVLDTSTWGVIGYLEGYLRVPVFAGRLWRVLRLVRREAPDVLVLVNFPGFNLAVARHLSALIPTVYYFPPMAYGRRSNRARKLARLPVRVLAPFPFEAELYREAGADVVFTGHPALDWVRPQRSREELCAALGLDPARPLVVLLPGSRTQEVHTLLPIMVEAVRLARLRIPHLRAVIAQASGPLGPLIARHAGALPVLTGCTHDLLAAADAALVASGTATLEALILGTPMVVAYRVSRATAWIARRIATTPWISLPNLLAGEEVVREMLQDRANPQALAAELLRILDPHEAHRMRRALVALRERLGPPGALERSAREVLARGRRMG